MPRCCIIRRSGRRSAMRRRWLVVAARLAALAALVAVTIAADSARPTVNSLGMTLIEIPAGSFEMGVDSTPIPDTLNAVSAPGQRAAPQCDPPGVGASLLRRRSVRPQDVRAQGRARVRRAQRRRWQNLEDAPQPRHQDLGIRHRHASAQRRDSYCDFQERTGAPHRVERTVGV